MIRKKIKLKIRELLLRILGDEQATIRLLNECSELRKIIRYLVHRLRHIVLLFLLPCIFIPLALLSRFYKRRIDIGLGPEPLINNIFHKKSLFLAGWTAETFVSHTYYITQQFDCIREDRSYYLAARALFRYKALYIYFNGGPLAWTPLQAIEPHIYRLAGIKVLVMPYGGDCQDLGYCPNYRFIHTMNMDYPQHARHRDMVAKRVQRWTRHADYIISGCDWVDYTPRWDSLCLAHFSIDTDELAPPDADFPVNNGSITILHAPNHMELKGTRFFVQAVEALQAEGYPVTLQLIQKMPNEELRELIRKADIIADQLVIGWYAMFALEGMSAGKPVLCYLRDDLVDLYEFAGLVAPGEIPLVRCDHRTVKEAIRGLLEQRERIAQIGKTSREYVVKHHSLMAIGRLFDQANRKMGLLPSAAHRQS